MARSHLALGMDIGGSGIKAALVDTRTGRFVSERRRVDTPRSLQPPDVLDAAVELVRGFQPADIPLGVGFPAVVVGGAPRTGFTAHQIEKWIGYPVESRLRRRLRRPVRLLNDADAAGLAEMRFGNGRGERGVVIVLTLGTGIGSGLFLDGRLVPNSELGYLFLPRRSRPAEYHAAASAREREELGWREWAARLSEYLRHVNRLFSPDLVILGGGVSKRSERFLHLIDAPCRVAAAALENRAGIVGAACAAMEASGR